MNVFNHIIVEEQIIGISPIQLEKGIWKDRQFFLVYTKSGAVPIHSEYFEARTPHGDSVLNRFQVDYDAAVASVKKVTHEETRIYCKQAAEVNNVYNLLQRDLDTILLAIPDDVLEKDRYTKDHIDIFKNRIAHLRNLALQ